MQSKEKKSDNDSTVRKEMIPIGFHMEADKLGNSLSVCIMGVISILDFCENCALMKTRRGKIKVVGSALSVAVYENKTVEIFGKVSGVEFL